MRDYISWNGGNGRLIRMSQKASMSWKCRWGQTEGKAGCWRGEETEALVSVRGDDRETAANKENRCQPSSGKHRDHTAKSRFLLFSQSNKTMAWHRLIKWVIEGVRALPSAPNISLPSCVSVSNPLKLGHCLSSSLFLATFPIWFSAEPCRLLNKCLPGQRVRNPAQTSSCQGVWKLQLSP